MEHLNLFRRARKSPNLDACRGYLEQALLKSEEFEKNSGTNSALRNLIGSIYKEMALISLNAQERCTFWFKAHSVLYDAYSKFDDLRSLDLYCQTVVDFCQDSLKGKSRDFKDLIQSILKNAQGELDKALSIENLDKSDKSDLYTRKSSILRERSRIEPKDSKKKIFLGGALTAVKAANKLPLA